MAAGKCLLCSEMAALGCIRKMASLRSTRIPAAPCTAPMPAPCATGASGQRRGSRGTCRCTIAQDRAEGTTANSATTTSAREWRCITIGKAFMGLGKSTSVITRAATTRPTTSTHCATTSIASTAGPELTSARCVASRQTISRLSGTMCD